MKYSENLNLNLPEGADPVDISKLSENFERLDVAVTDAASPFEIGDVLPTLRRDLGEGWILCNGEPLDAAQYPELAEMVPGLEWMVDAAAVTTVGAPLNGLTPNAGSFATDGVNQLITTQQGLGTNARVNYLLWSRDNFKTFTSVSAGSCNYIRPFFVNGYWIIFLFTAYGTNSQHAYRATKISANRQPFTDLSGGAAPLSSVNISDAFHVEYIDGKYYAFCTETGTGKPVVLAAQSPDFSNAAVSHVGTSGSYYRGSFLRTEDKFAFFGYSTNGIGTVSWSDKPASGYQTRAVNTANQNVNIAPYAFYGAGKPLYVDGKVFWVGSSGSSSKYKITIVCLGGIESGDVEYMDIMDTPLNHRAQSILDTGRGEYAIFWYDSSSESYLMVGTDLLDASTWKKYSLGAKAASVNYVCPQYTYNGTLNAFTTDGKVVTVPICATPKIGLSNCYAYIKAK